MLRFKSTKGEHIAVEVLSKYEILCNGVRMTRANHEAKYGWDSRNGSWFYTDDNLEKSVGIHDGRIRKELYEKSKEDRA